MRHEEMFEQLEKLADPQQGAKMAAYMQNRFLFLGLPKPALKAFAKPYLQSSRKAPVDWPFVFACWEQPYREAQYIAVEYLLLHQKQLTGDELENIRRLIVQKSWWETTDSLDEIVGTIIMKAPDHKRTMLEWSLSDELWLRRTAIDFQQKYKDRTDTGLLSQIIQNNLDSREFFITKAIGWSLREYSKTDPQWVQGFLAEFGARMAPLSKREAARKLAP